MINKNILIIAFALFIIIFFPLSYSGQQKESDFESSSLTEKQRKILDEGSNLFRQKAKEYHTLAYREKVCWNCPNNEVSKRFIQNSQNDFDNLETKFLSAFEQATKRQNYKLVFDNLGKEFSQRLLKPPDKFVKAVHLKFQHSSNPLLFVANALSTIRNSERNTFDLAVYSCPIGVQLKFKRKYQQDQQSTVQTNNKIELLWSTWTVEVLDKEYKPKEFEYDPYNPNNKIKALVIYLEKIKKNEN